MLLSILRFLRGTVSFELRDGYLEPFLNLCAKRKIPLWSVRRAGSTLSAKTSAAGGKRLRELAAKSGVTLRLTGRGGLPHLLRRYRLRAGLFAGFALLLLIPFFLSQFLWRVTISGNEAIPTGQLRDTLASLGVHAGAWRRGIDSREVERRLVIGEDKLSWAAVNLRGSTARVEVAERRAAPERVDRLVPHNIVAAKGGYITGMLVYEGQPTVKVGDSVLAGDILVSGIMEDLNGKNRTVHARAVIEAQIEDTLAVTVPYTRTAYVYRGLAVHRELNLFSHALPLDTTPTPKEPWKLESARESAPLLGRLMGATVTRKNYLLLEAVPESITPEEARLEAEEQLPALEARSFPQGGVLSREITGQELENSFILFADYLRLADIAQEREILRGENREAAHQVQ